MSGFNQRLLGLLSECSCQNSAGSSAPQFISLCSSFVGCCRSKCLLKGCNESISQYSTSCSVIKKIRLHLVLLCAMSLESLSDVLMLLE